MEKERLDIIKMYIYENIKILEDRKADKEDKKISRQLIKEEVECLEKHFENLSKSGTIMKIESFKKDMKEVENMLLAYIIKLARTTNKFDNEIYKLYANIADILFI